jgi:hypothetical protein
MQTRLGTTKEGGMAVPAVWALVQISNPNSSKPQPSPPHKVLRLGEKAYGSESETPAPPSATREFTPNLTSTNP